MLAGLVELSMMEAEEKEEEEAEELAAFYYMVSENLGMKSKRWNKYNL